MSEAGAGQPSAPQGGAAKAPVPGVPQIQHPRLKTLAEQPPSIATINSLADDAWEDLEAAGLTKKPSKKKDAPKVESPLLEHARKEESDEEPGDDEGSQAAPEDDDGEDAPNKSDDHEEQDTWGTEKDPWKLSDIPEDKFVRVKIDGEWQTVPLKEAVSGGIRTQTLMRRVNEAQKVSEEFKQIAMQERERFQKSRAAIARDLGNPETLFEHLFENNRGVLEQVSKMWAVHQYHAKRDPQYAEAKTREVYEKRERRMREAQEAHARSQQEAQQRQQATERELELLRPGYEQGLKEAGFPKVTKEFRRLLRAEVIATQEDKRGAPLTPEDMRAAVLHVAKYMKGGEAGAPGAPPQRKFNLGAKRPAGAPAPQQQRDNANTRSRSRREYKTHQEKFRSNDFFLEGVDLKGFTR
jgi:hypothetical protein